MKKQILVVLFVMMMAFTALAAPGSNDPVVGGAPMYPSKNIVQNASTADNLTTLVAAVKASRSGADAGEPRTIHCICAHQRRLRQAAGRHS